MALPPKTLEVDFRQSHQIRDLPKKLERWADDQGYVIRLLSRMDGMASILGPEQCNPLREADLPDEVREEVVGDITTSMFEKKDDGTFERGDCRLYIQSKNARDHMREIRAAERAHQESTEAIYEQVGDMNTELAAQSQGGVTPGFVTADPSKAHPNLPAPNAAPVGAHASGGQRELKRSQSLMERLESSG